MYPDRKTHKKIFVLSILSHSLILFTGLNASEKISRRPPSHINEIMDALKNNNQLRVKTLLSQVTKNLGSESADQLLIEAVDRGLVESTRDLLQAGVNKNAKCKKKDLSALCHAILGNHLNCVQILLEKNVDQSYALQIASAKKDPACLEELLFGRHLGGPNIDRHIDESALLHATKCNRQASVKLLIKAGCALDAVDDTGRTAMHLAAKRGYKDIIEDLLVAGASKELQCREFGQTPLHLSIRRSGVNRTFKSLSILLKYNCDVSIQDRKGQTVIDWAVSKNDAHCLELLLKAETHARRLHIQRALSQNNREGMMPLHVAAKKGSSECLALLLEAGADKNCRVQQGIGDDSNPDHVGATPLCVAAFYGQYGIIRDLLNRGANANLVTNKNTTALMTALENNHAFCFTFLVAWRSDFEIQNADGLTALHRSVQKGYTEFVALLLLNGAKTDAQSRDQKKTALHFALHTRQMDCLKLLLASAANPLIRDISDKSPLHYAIDSLLVEVRAQENNRDDDDNEQEELSVKNRPSSEIIDLLGKSLIEKHGYSILQIAVETNNIEDCKNALRGADDKPIDYALPDGRTALHIAVNYKYYDIIKLLLNHGASDQIENKEGKTVASIVDESTDNEIQNIFMAHGCGVCLQHTNEKACPSCTSNMHRECFENAFRSGGRCPVCRFSADTIIQEMAKKGLFTASQLQRKQNELANLLPPAVDIDQLAAELQ